MRTALSKFWNLEAFRSAVRAGIVIPGVFAFASMVIGRPQTSLFAAFGSFTVLVLVDFGGVPRARLLAYLGLAAAGAALITLGTVCSRDAWIATAAMALVAFVILFSGAFSGYLAAAANGATLVFVLSVNMRAPNSAIPDRLLGWALAAGAGTAAALLLWPSRRRADLRRAAAAAIRAVVELLEADGGSAHERSDAATGELAALERSFLGSQHRPAGPTAATAALIAIPDELDWLLSFVAVSADQPPLAVASGEEAEAVAATAAALRVSADRLDGGDAQADFGRLARARDELVRALAQWLPTLAADDETALPVVLEPSLRIRSATIAGEHVAEYAMRATAGKVPTQNASGRVSQLRAAERLVLDHAHVRSVWLRNSLRGAVALALATYIAERAGVANSFWIVLGTLSVLRSNALGTGRSIASALVGTTAGIVVGAALVIGIGTHRGVLWAVLPLAVAVAAYAPRAISFAAGQAAFTVVLLVLFNLIVPVGWSVGLVRVEDVAIGCAVSLGVGLLFWPRGASAALRADLADAYARAADCVVATVGDIFGSGEPSKARSAAAAADGALHELDDSFRQYLVERMATPIRVEDVAALVSGATRVRRTAQSLAGIAGIAGREPRVNRCGSHLAGELNAAHSWYVSLGHALVTGQRVSPPHLRDRDGRDGVFECVRAAARGGDVRSRRAALALVSAVQHLENLRRLELHLAARADAAQLAAGDRDLGLAG